MDLFIPISLVAGLIFGSFGTNVYAYYTGSSGFDLKRSKCAECGKSLSPFDLIPILSFILLRGKCRHCRTSIPPVYLLIELISGMAGMICYLYAAATWQSLLYFFCAWLLLMIALIDYKSYRIPNLLVGILLLSVLALMFLQGADFLTGLISSAAAIFFFLLIGYTVSKIKKRQALGGGDVKLIAVAALFFNPVITIIGIWSASILAIAIFLIANKLTNDKDEEKIPFGFSLGSVFLVLLFTQNFVLNAYFEIIEGLWKL